MPLTYTIGALKQLNIDISKPCIIFLYGDLGAGKTTLSSAIIQKLLNSSKEITSPTYVYYNKYDDIYHFDLYRLESYDQFISIGGEEILDNNVGIILVEWPERIEKYYEADIEIYLTKTSDDTRKIDIIYNKKAL